MYFVLLLLLFFYMYVCLYVCSPCKTVLVNHPRLQKMYTHKGNNILNDIIIILDLKN